MTARWEDFAKELRVIPRFTGDEPSPWYLRECLAAQTCAWCGRRGFKVVALHIAQAHGIDRLEVRELAGLMFKDSICDPDYAAACGARANPPPPPGKGYRKRLSSAAKALNARKLQQYADAVGPEAMQSQRVAAAARRAELSTIVRHCTNCGGECARARFTCSPKCRKAIRVKTAVATLAQRDRDRRAVERGQE